MGFFDRLTEKFKTGSFDDNDGYYTADKRPSYQDVRRQQRAQMYGFPERMGRRDWELIFESISEHFCPTFDSAVDAMYSSTIVLVDSIIASAYKYQGVIYFPPEMVSKDPMINKLLIKNNGDTHRVLCDLILILMAVTIVYRLKDEEKHVVHDMWEVAQSGELQTAEGEWTDFGDLRPIEYTIMAPVVLKRGERTPTVVKIEPKESQSPEPPVAAVKQAKDPWDV